MLPADLERELEFPVRVACIDVGSNALRFAAAEFESPERFRTIEQERAAVRLGHDVFLTGRLTDGAMDAALVALTSFWERIAKLDVAVYRAVATSAVRESSNGETFVERVRGQVGLELEIISGSEEARLVHAAVRRAVPLAGKEWVVVDVGGGSVEILLVDDSAILWSESHTMGSVRLLEELSETGEEPGRFRRLLEEYTATLRLPFAARSRGPTGFIATGGNAETLVQLAGTAAAGAGAAGSLSVDALRNIIEHLSRLSYRQRVDELGLREDRADVILPAAMVYEHLAGLSGASTIVVPGVGIREGVLHDLVEAVTTQRAHADRRDQELATALLAVGRRYMFDEAHARQVARLSLALFDQLRELHGLDDADRRVLQAAAWLHDVGSYISYKRHHKHSMYLITQSELPGLSTAQVELAATVARYHRKSDPGPQHEEFSRLKPADQKRVLALASLLRLADALDREHSERVRTVTMELQGRKALLRLEGKGDLLLEKWALKRKSALFERVFERELRVRNGGEH
ncbi:MAG: Ppx/GppA phosphatase family protein [Thermoanaerobaculaceae bacterium]|nr:Ppx/GppA phosphatase family protein [Thermoanaerobaculaceae bacterium]TAM46124.1 MAG: Ppx/GppA family phosphatase [Acidobacteriota bacterium]